LVGGGGNKKLMIFFPPEIPEMSAGRRVTIWTNFNNHPFSETIKYLL
jgi:hypothetical protein